jgi:tyrosine-protein phosphatase SIW14
MSKFFILLALTVFAISSHAADIEKEIPHFNQVTAHIYRGGRPSAAGLQELEQLGVKTIIDLENNSGAIQSEQAGLKNTSIQFVSVPLASWKTPKDADVEKVLQLLADPQNYPIFIHCQHGQDRTGLLVGLYRVFEMNWKPVDAYHEMKERGFHPVLFFLNHYFEKKTGFED